MGRNYTTIDYDGPSLNKKQVMELTVKQCPLSSLDIFWSQAKQQWLYIVFSQ